MSWVTILGLAAAVCTTTALLPQVLKSWKTKKTEDISLIMYIILITGTLLWLIYGVLIKNIPILAANSVGVIFISSVIILKLKHG